MKKYIISFLILTSVLCRGQVIEDSFFSDALDETKAIDVYLPPGYYANPNYYYPVIYFLHGWDGDENSVNYIIDLADSLISYNIIDPAILVGPNNNSDPFKGSFYTNSTINGDYETYSIDDVIKYIESNYRAYPKRNYRSLMGQSMGGYGCFRLGILHKELFRGIAAHGSPLNFDFVINDAINEITSENPPGPPYIFDYNNNNGIFTKMIFAMSAAFTPNDATPQTYINPQVVEFPVDSLGVLIDSIYQKWIPFDPVSFVNTLLPSDSLAILFGDGSNDNLHLYPGNVAFKDTLDSLGLNYEFLSHGGYHPMPYIFRDRGLKFLDSIMPPPSEIVCHDPSNLQVTNITQNSAEFSWSENWNTNEWSIYLGPEGFNTIDMTPTLVSTKPYQFSDLLANTSYDFYVQAICSIGGYSELVGPFQFKTRCESVSDAISEDFESESYLPDCWFGISSDPAVKIEINLVDSLSNSGSNSVVIFNDSLTSGFYGLSSPEFSELGLTTVEVQFSARTSTKPSFLFLGTMEDPYDTSTWNCIDTLSLSNQYQNFRLKIDALTAGSDGYIALRHTLDSAYIFVDDFNYKLSDKKISGSFKYYNNQRTPLSLLSLTLMDGLYPLETAITDENGNYEFADIPEGNYTINVSSTITAGGVNALDAGKVNLWWTNPTGIERIRWNAGDVNAIGNINSTDPATIQQHFVFGTQFDRGEWTYWKQNDISSSNEPTSSNEVLVSSENVSQNFYGLCVGDFKGDFVPNTSPRAYEPDINLTYHETILVGQEMEFELPIKVTSAMEVGALSLILNIPSNLVSVKDVFIGDGDFPFGRLDYDTKENELRIGWNSHTPVDLEAGSTLITLKLETTNNFNTDEEIQISIIPDPLNQLANKKFEAFENVILTTNSIAFSPTSISEFELNQRIILESYPNPFHESININYSIPVDGNVILEVYNIHGALVKTLVQERQKPGEYSIKYNSKNNLPGVYSVILRVQADGKTIANSIKIVRKTN